MSAAAIDGVIGEVFRQRLVADSRVVLEWVHGLPGPAADPGPARSTDDVTYQARSAIRRRHISGEVGYQTTSHIRRRHISGEVGDQRGPEVQGGRIGGVH